MSRWHRGHDYGYGPYRKRSPNYLMWVVVSLVLVGLLFHFNIIELSPQSKNLIAGLSTGIQSTEDIRTIPLDEESSRALGNHPGQIVGGRDVSSKRFFPLAGQTYHTANITSGYGKRWGDFHYGVDIGKGEGAPLLATEDAVVTEVWHQTNKGGIVVEYVPDGNKEMTIKYLHLSRQHVWGDKVVPPGAVYSKQPGWPKGGIRIKAGQHIADMGDTGYSFGPHLHFAIKVGNQWANPTAYLESLKAFQ